MRRLRGSVLIAGQARGVFILAMVVLAKVGDPNGVFNNKFAPLVVLVLDHSSLETLSLNADRRNK